MKKFLVACLPVLALAVPSQAHANGPWFQGNLSLRFFGSNTYFGLGPGTLQASPWYNYWPYEAHFQTPAPTGYPWWPAPQVPAPAPGYFPQAPAYVPPAPTPVPAMSPPLGIQPTSFYQPTSYQAPSYWYGR